MKQEVTIVFDRRIRQICTDLLKETGRDEICRLLLEHERKDGCIDRVCEQIRIAERSCNIGGEFKIKRFEILIHCACDMFVNLAVTHMKENALTEIERRRREDENNRIKNLEAQFAEEQKEVLDPRIKSFPGAAARRSVNLD